MRYWRDVSERVLDEFENQGFTILDLNDPVSKYGIAEQEQEDEYLEYLDSIAPDDETE